MDLIKHINERNKAERLSKLFWLIAIVAIGFGLMQFTEFGLLFFPSVRDFLSENVSVLPAGFWPILMFAFGAGFGLLGFFNFTPLRLCLQPFADKGLASRAAGGSTDRLAAVPRLDYSLYAGSAEQFALGQNEIRSVANRRSFACAIMCVKYRAVSSLRPAAL